MYDDAFNTTTLLLFKLAIISFIHSALFMSVMEGAIRQKSRLFLISSHSLTAALPLRFHRFGIAILIGITVGGTLLFALRVFNLQTMMVINAAILTLWYLEAGLMLARGFFTRLLGHDLPPPMVVFVSFILMINAGYFTLMFMMSLMRSETMI